VLFECKLSQTAEGYAQLRVLYAPLLENYFRKPVAAAVVFNYLRSSVPLSKVSDLLLGPIKDEPGSIQVVPKRRSR
jgi:hypothetical protein